MALDTRHIARTIAQTGLVCVAVLGVSAFRTPGSSPMPLAAPARAPIAYLKFCAAHQAECIADTGSKTAATGPHTPVAARIDVQPYGGGSTTRRGLRAPIPRADTPTPAGMEDGAALFAMSVAAAPQPSGADEVLRLDRKMWRTIRRVNRDVNRQIEFASDDDVHGAADVWSLPLTEPRGDRPRGDCEDYALEKRRALRAAGVPSEALAPAVVVLPDGRWHAVLVVATDRGDYVLDNRFNQVKPWRELDYFWITRETGARADQWRFVSNFGK